MFIFYAAGFVLKESDVFSLQIKRVHGVIAIIAFGMLFLIYRVTGLSMDYRVDQLGNIPISLFVSFIGIYGTIVLGKIVLVLFKRIHGMGSFSNAMINIGKHSFHYMAIQFLAMKPVALLLCLATRIDTAYIKDFGMLSIFGQPLRLIGFMLTVVLSYIIVESGYAIKSRICENSFLKRKLL